MTEQEYLERLDAQDKRLEEHGRYIRDAVKEMSKFSGAGMLGFQAAATILPSFLSEPGTMEERVGRAIVYATELLRQMGYVK